MLVGKARLKRHDGRRSIGAALEPGEVEHLRDMLNVLGPDLPGLVVVFEVVLAIRQAKSALPDVNHVVVRILEIGHLAKAERSVHVAALGLGEVHGEVVIVGDRGDAIELRLQRRDTPGVPRFPIEEGLVHVADFLFVGALLEITRRRLFDDGLDGFLRLIAQRIEDAVASFVRRNLGAVDPGAIHVGEEVVTRLDALVHPGKVEAGNQFLRFLGRLLGGFLAARSNHQQRGRADN